MWETPVPWSSDFQGLFIDELMPTASRPVPGDLSFLITLFFHSFLQQNTLPLIFSWIIFVVWLLDIFATRVLSSNKKFQVIFLQKIAPHQGKFYASWWDATIPHCYCTCPPQLITLLALAGEAFTSFFYIPSAPYNLGSVRADWRRRYPLHAELCAWVGGEYRSESDVHSAFKKLAV